MSKPALLIFNQHSSYITIDIANTFQKSGKFQKIVLMTGIINVRETELDPSIKVIKTLKYNKRNILTRFSSWLLSFLHFILVVNLKFRSSRLFLVSNPPLTVLTPYFCKNQFSTLIFDVYPDALKATGFIKNDSFIYKLWAKSNLRFYRKAKQVYTISVGMKRSISQYCHPEKIEVVNLWSSFQPQIIQKKENSFIRQQQLENKFIVMYSGNMGKDCGLDSFIEVAIRLKGNTDILFLFIGEGWMINELKALVKQRQLQNCKFLPYQPASILKHSLSAADLSIITLPPEVSEISIPNKTFSLIALGRALLCLSTTESDLSDLITGYNIGKCFDNREIDAIVDYIIELKTNDSYALMLQNNSIKCAGSFTKSNAMAFAAES